jgi:dethiobiotin synthetase
MKTPLVGTDRRAVPEREQRGAPGGRALPGLFITGTDTGVGKTHVTAALLHAIPGAGAFKPIACGPGGRNDAKLYARLMKAPVDVINPIYLRRPLAPLIAARLESRSVDLRLIVSCYESLVTNYRPLFVEGAGGLLVPIKRNYFVADLARELQLPVVIVARLGLGTINHTLLTVRQARASGLEIAGVILNDTTGHRGLAERTNARAVAELCGVPLLGVVPHARQPDVRAIVQRIKKRLRNSTGS